MNNILFPTDFTDVSLNAFSYALEYAIITNSKLIVYHAYDPENVKHEETRKLYEKVDIENFRNKKDKFPPFEKLIAAKDGVDVKLKYVVEEGEFINVMKSYVKRKEDKIEMVIMGTQEPNNGLFDIFMETKTSLVLEEINKPVIAIPERATFDGSIDNIVFLVDYREDELDPVQQVIVKSKELNAKLHVVHFDLAHGESVAPLMAKFKGFLEVDDVENINFVSIDTISLKQSLVQFCKENKIDMVCLVNHKRNFYQRLFSLSLTQDLLNNIDVPIMAIYQE